MSFGQALVVGGTSEIGRAIAAALAQEGYDLALWGRDRTRLRAAAGEMEALGRRCTTYALDVTDQAAVQEQLARVVTTGKLSVVVWAAGVFDWAPADEADPQVWAQVLHVNLTAAAVLTALALPALVRRRPQRPGLHRLQRGSPSVREQRGLRRQQARAESGWRTPPFSTSATAA